MRLSDHKSLPSEAVNFTEMVAWSRRSVDVLALWWAIVTNLTDFIIPVRLASAVDLSASRRLSNRVNWYIRSLAIKLSNPVSPERFSKTPILSVSTPPGSSPLPENRYPQALITRHKNNNMDVFMKMRGNGFSLLNHNVDQFVFHHNNFFNGAVLNKPPDIVIR